jgi:hypothetical protein
MQHENWQDNARAQQKLLLEGLEQRGVEVLSVANPGSPCKECFRLEHTFVPRIQSVGPSSLDAIRAIRMGRVRTGVIPAYLTVRPRQQMHKITPEFVRGVGRAHLFQQVPGQSLRAVRPSSTRRSVPRCS